MKREVIYRTDAMAAVGNLKGLSDMDKSKAMQAVLDLPAVPTCEDAVSRQQAIDRINKQREHLEPDVYPQDKIGDAAYRICAEFIERLPAVQSQGSIRCKDCKWCEDADGLMCKNPASWVVATDRDFGCVLAERRTDGSD